MSQPQPKTILAWFEEARAAGHEWADAAIENCHQFGTAYDYAPTLLWAVDTAFAWAETKQGFEMWNTIGNSLRQNP